VSANSHLLAFAPDGPSGRQQQGASGPGRSLAEVALATPIQAVQEPWEGLDTIYMIGLGFW
jgi:hypothetical protein